MSAATSTIQAPENPGALLPLYAASLLVTLCGVGIALVAVEGVAYVNLSIWLVVLGHVTSLVLRWRRVPLGWVLAVVGLGAIFTSLQAPAAYAALGLAHQPVDLTMVVVLTWVVVLRSFALLSNGALLFSIVPTLGLLGLMGSYILGPEVPILFGLAIFGTILIAIYVRFLERAGPTAAAQQPLGWHLLTAGAIFLTSVLGATLFALVGTPVLTAVGPYRAAIFTPHLADASFAISAHAAHDAIPIGAGPVTLSSTPVLDVYTQESGPLLLRSGNLYTYTGRGWSQEGRPEMQLSLGRPSRSPRLPEAAAGRARTSRWWLHEFPSDPDLENTAGVRRRRVEQAMVTRQVLGDFLPALVRPVEVYHPTQEIGVDPAGVVYNPFAVGRGASYRVISEVVDISPSALRGVPAVRPEDPALEDALRFPVQLQRVRETAWEVTEGLDNDYDRVLAIIQHIERTCRYTLVQRPTPAGRDPVEYYLFDSRRGACDLAASAAVLLCRAVGIPARIVTGYYVDERLENGSGFTARHSDAHMWFETYFPGYGWVPFNPAPRSQDLEGSGFTAFAERVMLFLRQGLGGGIEAWLLWTTVLIISGSVLHMTLPALLRAWRGRRRRIRHARLAGEPLLYRDMLRLLRRRGWQRPPALTPREYLRWLADEWGPDAPALEIVERLTDAFQDGFYGRQASPAERLAAARADLRRLRRLVPRRKRHERPALAPAR